MDQYGLPAYDAEFLASSHESADYFEACVRLFPQAKSVSNWIMGPLGALLNAENISIEASPVTPKGLADLLALVEEGVISGKIAKTVFDDMAKTGKSPQDIVQEKGLVQVRDTDAIEAAVDKVIAENPKEVEAYRGGKLKLIGFFVGQVMRETRGKANPQLVNEVLAKKLTISV